MMIKVRKKLFSPLQQLLVLACLSLAASAQSNVGMKKTFAKAESFFLFEEYEQARELYLQINTPDNFNIQYKIGLCYLNILGESEKAIPFLESAVKNSSYDARINSFKEKRAPLDAYFFLAKAYMINNDLENARTTFNKFKTLASEIEEKGGMKNPDFIDQQIRACENAIKSQGNPSRISKRLLGPGFSNSPVNENPAVSFDGNTIVYTERKGVLNSIMFSKKINGKWQTPIEINEQLKSGDDCSSCSLNSDGTVLFLYKKDNYDGNIYSAEFINGAWTPIKKLNININTKYFESHASISPDGKKLYFTSNREGGHGGLDIYLSEKDASGNWGLPVNLGTAINTIFNEDTPFITINDSLLYFSSEGHSGLGGYDIFRSRGNGTAWKQPENLGSPLNTTDDDLFFQPFDNDEHGFYSLITNYKKKDIFYITLTNPELDRIYQLAGNYSLRDTVTEFDERNAIYLVDGESGDTLETGFPDRLTGQYDFIVAHGKFGIIYSAPGYYPQRIDTTILMDAPSGVIHLADIILDKNPPVVYEKLDLSDIPVVDQIDPNILIRDLRVYDVTENDRLDTTILYYTVQVMALYNPVDISYFRHVSDIKVFYNEADLFYRYTTGMFTDKNEAYAHRDDLFRKGYPDDLFIKKVTKTTGEKAVPSQKYYSIQLKATSIPVDINSTFPGLKGVREAKEIDGMYHYLYGRYTSADEANTVLQRKQIMEFGDAFVREISVLIKK
jgi:tetratricopeptide (TPR) repeat protein